MIVINAQQLDNFVWLDEFDYLPVAELALAHVKLIAI